MARAEVGCSAPVNNVPPSSVLACASLLTQSVIDTLAGRFELVDEVYAASNPDPLKLLAFRGPAEWPTGILARRRQRGIDQIGERSRRLLIRRSRVRTPEGPPPHFFIRAHCDRARIRAWSCGLHQFGSGFRLTSSPHQSVHGGAEKGANMVAELVLHADDGMGLDEANCGLLGRLRCRGEEPSHRRRPTLRRWACSTRSACSGGSPSASPSSARPTSTPSLKVIADRGVSLGTRHRRFRETRAFFSWCTRMGGCARSPFTGIPKREGGAEGGSSRSRRGDIQALLAVCDSGEEFGCRNRAIILLFLDTGMRYAELHQLTLADVSWENRRIHIRHGRGRKQRVVPFGDGPEAALRDYVEGFRGEDDGPLFLTISRWGEPRRPMNKYLLGTLFARLLQRGVAVRHEPIRAWEGRVAPLLADRPAREAARPRRPLLVPGRDRRARRRALVLSLSRPRPRWGGSSTPCAARTGTRMLPGASCGAWSTWPSASRSASRRRPIRPTGWRSAGSWGSKGRHRCHQSLINRIEQGPPGRHAALSPAARLRELRVCCAVLFRVR